MNDYVKKVNLLILELEKNLNEFDEIDSVVEILKNIKMIISFKIEPNLISEWN